MKRYCKIENLYIDSLYLNKKYIGLRWSGLDSGIIYYLILQRNFASCFIRPLESFFYCFFCAAFDLLNANDFYVNSIKMLSPKAHANVMRALQMFKK